MSSAAELSPEPSFAITREIRDGCFCLAARRAARALARRYDEALRPAGLTSGQFSLLVSLNRPTPPTIAEVATLLAMDRTTVTANVKPLALRGLLVRTVDLGDRRSRRLGLTAAGRMVLRRALPLWREAQAASERRAREVAPELLRAALRALA